MGWASGFAAGTQMARGWIDTYKDAKESTGRGLANQEILAAQKERERQMQQAVTPGISSGPEQNMSPSATPTTAATLPQNKLPMAPSAGGLGTPPQMSPVTRATPDLLKAVEQVESGGNVNAVSPAGARGPMQLMPATAAQPGYGVAPAANDSVEENRRVGADYLNAMLAKYNGDVNMALAAYNQGPGATDKWIADGADPAKMPGGAETRNYADKVMAALGNSSPTSADGRMTMQDIIAKDQRPAQPAGDGSQRRTGLGNLAAEIDKEMDVLDIYRKYNLLGEITSQENKISGLKSAYEEQSRYERQSEIDAEQREHTRKQDKINSDRLNAVATANINSINYELEQLKADSASADAVAFGENAYQRVISSGGSLESLLQSIDAQYAENPKQLIAARKAATGKFYADNGFNAQTAGYISQQARKPIENFLAKDFGDDEAQTIASFNSSLAEMFDPNLADGKPTKIRPIKNQNDKTVGYEIVNGEDNLETFSSLAEVRTRAEQELAAVQDNPFYLVGVIQRNKDKAAYEISKAKTLAEKEKLFGNFLKDNPQYVGDGMAPQLLRIRGEFGLDGLAGWGNDNAPRVINDGLAYDPDAEMEKLTAERAAQEKNTAQLRAKAQKLIDNPNIDVNALLSQPNFPKGLRTAVEEAYAAKRTAYLESLDPARRAFETGGLRSL